MKKKGFTLVELLAVIVILAVIALIATPTILGVIEKSRKGAANSSALGYIDALEKQIAINEMDTNKTSISDGTYHVGEIDISYKGKGPVDGNYVIEKGIVTKGIFLFGEYYVCYSENKVTSNKDENKLTDCSDIAENVEYKETILNGAYPKISGELIPVTIEDDGTVKKADINSKWYSYQEKKWANAVILVDNTISYEDGEEIPEENIESYFVWIPRYKYKLFNLGEYTEAISEKPETSIAHTIEIVFESKDTNVSSGDEVGEYLTHPAFITMNTNGLWVGKYETGYSGATSKTEAQVNSSDSSKIIVKPNVYSWRYNTVSNMFVAAYNYNRELDSHMMKNTEWGAVAYLSHSEYGINTEININNNSNYITGYSAVEGTDQSSYPGTSGTDSSVTLAYNTETGYKASSTGNITGIYDMSGGTWEYMASYMDGVYGNSGFDATSIASYDSKYFDVYPSDSTITSYNNRILGDATGEMGPFYYYQDMDGTNRYHNNWYAVHSYFVDSSNPWFGRGGGYRIGVLAGRFFFNGNTGGVAGALGSRLVLIG